MRTYRFKHVDVFTSQPLQGNPLAVFPDASGLTDQEMQRIARELNLSEATFIFNPTEPGADYKNRIFTPAAELPFAGHPSIGTAYVLAKEARRFQLRSPVTTVRQEIKIGVLPLDIHYDGKTIGMIEMTQGKPQMGRTVENLDALAKTLRIPAEEITATDLRPQVSSTGVNQLMVPVKSLWTVTNLKPDLYALDEFARHLQADGGVYIFTNETQTKEADFHARFFASGLGVSEDPATGSAAGALGAYLAHSKQLPHSSGEFVIEQGIEIGRPSILHVKVEEGSEGMRVKVGGNVVDVIEGQVAL